MGDAEEKEALERLRRLLLSPEQARLTELDADLSEPARLAAHLRKALPLAVKQSAGAESRLGQALAPILEEVIQTTIRRNPRLMAEILYPVIGRTVRKAVWEAWSQLIQTVNGALETRISFKSLKWRWIAWRTGRTFAEIVLAQTFVYRVDQVLLIHRESGLLLGHETRATEVAKDKELVSAMLTAIQDFVRDSFDIAEETPLGALEVGGLKVWIEQGPKAYLAAVIRGNPPAELHAVLRDTLEQVHFEFEPVLQDYRGESEDFATVGQFLLGAMRYERQVGEEGSGPWYALALGLVPLFLVSWFGFYSFQTRHRLAVIQGVLDATPGYHIVAVRDRGNYLKLEGFRDPLASPPGVVLGPLADRYQWLEAELTPYIALHPSLVLKRARRSLAPPLSVRLTLNRQGRLSAAGGADAAWLARFEAGAPLLAGVTAVDARDVVVLKTRSELLVAELTAWELRFEVDQAELSEEQTAEIAMVAAKVAELNSISRAQNEILVVEIQGFTDASGSRTHNQELALRRAESVRAAFVTRGIPPDVFRVKGFINAVAGGDRDRRILLAIQFQQP
ncbi:OmpA family protein [Acanthopleuribacter pedis]|uniref:OmpA family protein n=1 Tax=Acanthopleuribacter pedis TaxID=442870 RepID=A0A8J7QJG9_9BACT|nr:OmpA family protein [Acanthopleuribacter pedis]MBO1319343.1 OmpA family protein [Acanthopleuribacter pedis]